MIKLCRYLIAGRNSFDIITTNVCQVLVYDSFGDSNGLLTLLPEIEKIVPFHPTRFITDSILVLLMLTLDKFHIVLLSSFIFLNMFLPHFRGKLHVQSQHKDTRITSMK